MSAGLRLCRSVNSGWPCTRPYERGHRCSPAGREGGGEVREQAGSRQAGSRDGGREGGREGGKWKVEMGGWVACSRGHEETKVQAVSRSHQPIGNHPLSTHLPTQ